MLAIVQTFSNTPKKTVGMQAIGILIQNKSWTYRLQKWMNLTFWTKNMNVLVCWWMENNSLN
jgi:hypothetical protein